MIANNALMAVAMSQLGNKEIVGHKHEPEVMKYYDEIGHEWVDNDELPWCAAFMNWVCLHALVPMVEKSQRLRARAFEGWGEGVYKNDPMQGDVVVLWRDSKVSSFGHVGLLVGWSPDGDSVYLLGGNQANQVKVAKYPANRITAIRRGSTNNIIFAPKL